MDKEIYSIISEYKKRLELSGVKINKIMLYGSYASGRANEESDLDLVIVSDSFKDMDLWERLSFLGRIRAGIRKPMEILGLTKEEFESEYGDMFMEGEVKSKGIEIK